MRPSSITLLALAGLTWFEASGEDIDLSSEGLATVEDACVGEEDGECALSLRQLRGKRALELSPEARGATAASKPKLMKGVSYGPVPLKSSRGGSTLHEDDWMAPAAKPMWGPAGRWDLGVIAALGANFVRLYGNDPNNDHSEFLDEALRNGLQVAPGMSDYPYYQMKGSCRTTGYDCYSQVKELYSQNLKSGFLTKDKTYHPALAYFSIINEPDLKMPPTATGGGYAGVAAMCKAIVSAFDAVLDAEKESGVQGAGINFTATFSFAVCSSCSWFKRNPALGQMTQLEDAMLNPMKYGYMPRNDIPKAFKTRWTNSFNTQNKASDLPHMLLSDYDKTFKDTPVYIAEYHSTYVNETSDLQQILHIAEHSHLFLGISYFEYQVAYWKGGTEEAFGMFGLGDYTVAQMPYYGKTYQIDCLVPVFSRRAGTTQTAALAMAYGGKYLDPQTLCKPNPMSVPISGEGYAAIAQQGGEEAMASFTTRVVEHLGGIVVSKDGLDAFSKQYVAGTSDSFGEMVEGIVEQPDWTRFKAGARCIADRSAFPDVVAGAIGYACQNETRFNCSKLQVPDACTSTYDTGDLFFSHFYASQPDADPLEVCAFGGAAVYASPELYPAVKPECVAEAAAFKAEAADLESGKEVHQVRPVHTLGTAQDWHLPAAEPADAPSPAAAPGGAEQGEAPSCALYGCVGYTASNQCQCNPGCEKHGSCCSDYAAKCKPSWVATLAAFAARGGGPSAGPPPAEPAPAGGLAGGGLRKGPSCGLEEDSKLMLLLSSLGIQGPEIRGSLDKMVSALPASAGKADYSKLKLLEIYDPCMLKASFWNKDDKDFEAATGMNYVKARIKNLTPDLVEPYDFKGSDSEMLDTSWCYNEWTDSSVSGGLKDMGFASHTPVSIMDHMMEPEDFKALVHADLGVTGAKEAQALVERLQQKPVPEALKTLIEEADVIASSGGNPDLATFVYRAFPGVADLLTKKLKQGKAVYLGRSASSMVMGANAAFSDEPTPEMLENVLAHNTHGLALLPKCIVKPHFKTESHEAYASALEDSTGLRVVRMPNLAAWVCQSGSCKLEGSPNPQDLQWHNSAGHYNEHLDALFHSLN